MSNGPWIKDGQIISVIPSPLNTPTGVVFGAGEAVLLSLGWRKATQDEIDARNAESEAAAQAAEAARIAGKSDDLKKAENRFLAALAAWSADHPEQAITPADGFLQIDTKIEASGLNDAQKLKIGAKLRNYWDVVLFHGGKFGDVQYHEGVQP